MDYEKEYKKLKAGISNAYLYAQTDSTKAVLENILPELVESEDERARKFLVKHVSEWIGCIEHDLKLSSKDVESEEELAMFKAGLAYLERQKEQKPVISDDAIREGVAHFGITQYQIDNWLKKHINVIEQKPAWSEEDEKNMKSVVSTLWFALNTPHFPLNYERIIELEGWLKSLRPQPKQEQNDYITPHKKFFKFIYDRLINVYKENPNVDYMRSFKERLDNLSFEEKQEWNEENEDMLNSCISSIEEAKENRYAYKETDGDTSYDHEIAWLESLRNRVGKEFLQPHWKPSEEQIGALSWMLENARGNIDFDPLKDLYEQLKKLM